MAGKAAPVLPVLMTIEQVAAYLQVPEETLRCWRRDTLRNDRLGKDEPVGPPSFLLKGTLLRYRTAAVDAWLAEQEAAPPGAA